MIPYDNPSDARYTGRNNFRHEHITHRTPTLGDWIITASIVSLFAVGILYTIFVQHFS